jgi:8-oxo-dGTP pyrophosphatase MutT (NUDIX family)
MPPTYATALADNLFASRATARLSQADVSERMHSLGFGAWQRSTMSLVERAQRRVTAEEVAGLALVLQTTVARLVTPADERKTQVVELPSGHRVPRSRFLFDDGSVEWRGNVPVFPAASGRQKQIRAGVTELADWVQQVRETGADIELEVAPGELAAQPVVAAIITSPLGVLVTRRRDGTPPWGFLTGEVEPGERPEDAAEREAKEEAGLLVLAGAIIGERDHPQTGRHMIYMACAPTNGLEVHVGDEAELAEVRWASLAEAEELLPGMHEPVHVYLAGLL